MKKLTLKPGALTLDQLRSAYFDGLTLEIEDAAWVAIEKAQALVQEKVESGEIVYGINTGFGQLAQKQIKQDSLSELQHKLILTTRCIGLKPSIEKRLNWPKLTLGVIKLLKS